MTHLGIFILQNFKDMQSTQRSFLQIYRMRLNSIPMIKSSKLFIPFIHIAFRGHFSFKQNREFPILKKHKIFTGGIIMINLIYRGPTNIKYFSIIRWNFLGRSKFYHHSRLLPATDVVAYIYALLLRKIRFLEVHKIGSKVSMRGASPYHIDQLT